jgi:alkaline phosphatase D
MSPCRPGRSGFQIDRRTLVTALGALGAGLVGAPAVIGRALAQLRRWPDGDPFSLGVASGAPRPDGVVLWTRLAPVPLSADPATPGGMTGGDVPVGYEIASDVAMRDIVRRGVATAEAAFAWSVHADISGLQPGRSYWYRFMSGDAVSPVGRTMTAVAAGTPVARMRFGFVSCSHYEHGYFFRLSPSRRREPRYGAVSRRLHLREHRAIPPHRAPPQRRH